MACRPKKRVRIRAIQMGVLRGEQIRLAASKVRVSANAADTARGSGMALNLPAATGQVNRSAVIWLFWIFRLCCSSMTAEPETVALLTRLAGDRNVTQWRCRPPRLTWTGL